eukprot:6195680-Pleurochrysis_carterae.AAC.1
MVTMMMRHFQTWTASQQMRAAVHPERQVLRLDTAAASLHAKHIQCETMNYADAARACESSESRRSTSRIACLPATRHAEDPQRSSHSCHSCLCACCSLALLSPISHKERVGLESAD